MQRFIHETKIFLAIPLAVHVCVVRLLIKLKKQSAAGSIYFKLKRIKRSRVLSIPRLVKGPDLLQTTNHQES